MFRPALTPVSPAASLAAEDVAPYGATAPAPANEPAGPAPLAAWAGCPSPPPEAFWPVSPPSNATFWQLHQGDRATFAIEGLLARAARADAALELALGHGLLQLQRRGRLKAFALTNIHDYAREKLGLGTELVRKRLRLARQCRRRPLLEAALRTGQVKLRAAELVASLAVGDDEAAWVERARTLDTRALAKAVRAARAERAGRAGTAPEPDPEQPEPWVTFEVKLDDGAYEIVDQALSAAAHHLGCEPDAPACLEALAQEFLGAFAAPEAPPVAPPLSRSMSVPRPPPATRLPGAGCEVDAALVRDLARALEVVEAPRFPVPEGLPDDATALEIHARLLELAAMRTSWDRVLGHLAACVRSTRLWYRLGYASFAHYCEQRLGLSARSIEGRCAVERRLWQSRELRAARDLGLSFEKVRCLSWLRDQVIPAWTEKARGLTVIQLQRAVRRLEAAQMRTTHRLRRLLPPEVAGTLSDAFRTVRAHFGENRGDGTCLTFLALHFLGAWGRTLPRRYSRSQRIRERDGGCCQVPMCSRPAAHAHHLEFRSRGGGNEQWNQTSLCLGHHLHFIHTAALLKVQGRAPDQLTWTLAGERWTGPAEPPGPWGPGWLASGTGKVTRRWPPAAADA